MRIIGNILNDMIKYYGNDVRLTNHALKVYGFVKCIGESENLDKEKMTILEIAAVLHDIGIPESIRKFNSAEGKYQEAEGAIITRDILNKFELPEEIKDRVCFLIANHHSYNKIDDVDFQILIEADFYVNIFEKKIEKDKVEHIKSKYFKTKTGIDLIDTMYLN